MAGSLRLLKLRITVGGIVALAIGIGLITALLVMRAQRDTLNTQLVRESTEAVRTAAALSSKVVELQRLLASVSPQFGDIPADDRIAVMRLVESQRVLRQLFTSLFAASADGQVLVTADSQQVNLPASLYIGDRDYFQQSMRENRAIISDVTRSRVNGNPLILLTQPVHDAAGKPLIFGGSLRLNTRDLLDGLVENDSDDATAMVVVTDQAGRVLAHPNRNRLLTLVSAEPRLAQAFAAWQSIGSRSSPRACACRSTVNWSAPLACRGRTGWSGACAPKRTCWHRCARPEPRRSSGRRCSWHCCRRCSS